MPFGDPIVAGNTLVRDAIQSPNYVAGVSGWTINRDGSAEFSNVVVRGTFVAGTAPDTLTVNAGGLEYFSTANNLKENIDDNLSFIVQWIPDPPITNYGQLTCDVNGGILRLGATPSTNALDTLREASLRARRAMVGSVSTPELSIVAPFVSAPISRAVATISMKGGASDGSVGSDINLQADNVHTFSAFAVGGLFTADSVIVGKITITPSAANTPTSQLVTFPRTLSGSNFICVVTANSSVPGTTVTGTGYTAVSATDVTIWLTRTNTTATIISYLVMGF